MAHDTSPSIPLAPRLARTDSPPRAAICWSRSRTGRLDAAHSRAPSGSRAATSRASRGSLSSSDLSSSSAAAELAAASAARHEASHGPPAADRGAPVSRTWPATSVALRPGSDHRPGPAEMTT
jgi:hypothetical protein